MRPAPPRRRAPAASCRCPGFRPAATAPRRSARWVGTSRSILPSVGGARLPSRRRRFRFCMFGRARQDPYEVGESVEIRDQVRTGLQTLALEGDSSPLASPEDRPGELEGGAGWRLAGNHELAWHLDVFLQLDEVPLDAPDHRLRDASSA